MSSGLLHTHSLIRYFVLALLLIVIAKSLLGWRNNKPYTAADNKLSLWLLIATHTQFVVGLILYFVSPVVQFSSSTMKDGSLRYWTVEHFTGMIIAVVLITVGRSTHKKLPTDLAKHKRLFIMNTIALVIILGTLLASGRGLLSSSMLR